MANWYENEDNPQRSQKQKKVKRRDKEQRFKKKRLEHFKDDSFLTRKEQKDEKNWMR